MAFAYDIFLSYSEKDNEVLPGYDSGWVDTFKKFLTTVIGQLLQHEPKIITNHEVVDKNFNPLEQACVVVYLISEDYVRSEEFGKETNLLRLFLSQTSVMRIDGKLRMFKVSKSHVESENLPPVIKDLISYDLFMYDPFTGVMKEFDAFFGQDAEKTYWTRLIDLAYDMYKVIYYNQNQLNHSDIKQKAINVLPEECIYLAETGNDLLIQKNIIRRELERHGYRVLPDQQLSILDNSVIDDIKRDLVKCKLSIHLIGKYFADENMSHKEDIQLMKLQNQLAALHSMDKKKDDPFKRLLWMPEDISVANETHQITMSNLINNPDFIYGADIVKNSIEEFKSLIKRELSSLKQQGAYSYIIPEPELTADKGKNIYLIVDAADVNQCQPVINYLKQNGYDVLLPLFEGDVMEMRGKHRANLEVSDACIIFSDRVSVQWVKSKVMDVVKAPGFRKVKKNVFKAVYFISDKGIPQSYFEQFNFTVLHADSGVLAKDHLHELLKQITI